MTPKEVYEEIYHEAMTMFICQGETEDNASRRANVVAVQETWQAYNDIKSHR